MTVQVDKVNQVRNWNFNTIHAFTHCPANTNKSLRLRFKLLNKYINRDGQVFTHIVAELNSAELCKSVESFQMNISIHTCSWS